MPDVILLDIQMPKMDGYQVLSEIKKSLRLRDIPVIFITGLSNDDAEEKGLDMGAADYITKPFSAEVVKLRVWNQIGVQRVSTLKNSVLIVDDDKAAIIALNQMLSNEYDVSAAKNGLDAIRIAEKTSPDVILLDINMPGMDGYEVLSILKNSETAKDIPVIFITGLSDVEDEIKGLDLGAADYIAKPFSRSVVKLRIKNKIGLQRFGRAKRYERRNCFRFTSLQPVTIQRPFAGNERLIEGKIINISDGGMLFTSGEEIDKGERIKLTFNIGENVSVMALALRKERKGPDNYKMAVQLKTESESQKDQIYKFLLKTQMKKRKL